MKPILARLKQLGEAIDRAEARRAVGRNDWLRHSDLIGKRVRGTITDPEARELQRMDAAARIPRPPVHTLPPIAELLEALRRREPGPEAKPETPAPAPEVNSVDPGEPAAVSEPVVPTRPRPRLTVVQSPEPDNKPAWFKPGRDDRFDDPMHGEPDD